MFKNYFKVALKALRRNKLYTGVSLFGISLTLAVLMLAYAVFENELGSNPPLSKKDRILFLTGMQAEKYRRLTETSYDSVRVNGIWKVDTVVTTRINEAERGGMAAGGFSNAFAEKYIDSLPEVKASTFFISGRIDLVADNRLLNWEAIYTDNAYWEVFDFEFLEGVPFSPQAVENQARQVILTESAARKYFGKQDRYIGRVIDRGFNGKFEVTGVVKNARSTNEYIQADCFLPESWFHKNFSHDMFGMKQIAVLTGRPQDVPLLRNGLKQVETVLNSEGDYDRYTIKTKESGDMYAESILGESEKERGKEMTGLFYSAMLLFVTLPLLNLINLNNSRVTERSVEIGVRKAFGATSQHILKQFLFENLIITVAGGILGFGIAFVVMQVMNHAEFFDSSRIALNPRLLLIYSLIILIFTGFSGVVPALRISKTQIVNALKSYKL